MLVQDTLVAGADAAKLLADGQVVALVALSGMNPDPDRPRSGNWMNNTRAWLVGRNSARDACRGDQRGRC